MVEVHGGEFTLEDLVVKYDPDEDIHYFFYKIPQKEVVIENKKGVLDEVNQTKTPTINQRFNYFGRIFLVLPRHSLISS